MFTEMTNKNAAKEKYGRVQRVLRIYRWLPCAMVASVWAYHGMYSPRNIGDPAHLQAFDMLPFANPAFVLIPLSGLAFIEAGLAVWVICRTAPRRAAWVQSLLLLGLNLCCLLWAPESLCSPLRMIVQNLAFLALIWIAATLLEGPRHGRTYA